MLVMDNLNTHRLSSLYEVFPAERARRIAARFEVHHTPKHGRWLNMAEIEIGILNRQCLDRRIPDIETVRKEVSAWVRERNGESRKVNGQFTTQDARVKLRHLYPQV